jgi:Protein of unknown function (DUF1573)
MHSMRKVGLALLVTVLLPQAAAAQGPAWADKLFGGETSHDFKVVPHGAQLKHTFKMTNIYKEPLEISQIRVSCSCVTASASAKVLQPNESADLNLLMDARQFSGPKEVTLYVSVGPKYVSTATLKVKATARQDVVFNPGEIDFGHNVPRGQTPTRNIDVEYAGTFDWRVVEIVKSAGAPFDLKVEELPRQVSQVARRGYRVLATLKADAPAGPFKQEVILKTNDPTSPVLTFNVVGAIQAALIVQPGTVAVGGLKVGETQTKKIVVRAQRPFRIKAIDGQGDGITADIPNPPEPAATLILTLSIQPQKAGELRRQLTIRTDLDNETAVLTVEGDIAP